MNFKKFSQIEYINCDDNKITSLSSFNIKGLSTFDCTHNNLPKAECDRIIALGYKEYFVNPQNDNI